MELTDACAEDERANASVALYIMSTCEPHSMACVGLGMRYEGAALSIGLMKPFPLVCGTGSVARVPSQTEASMQHFPCIR